MAPCLHLIRLHHGLQPSSIRKTNTLAKGVVMQSVRTRVHAVALMLVLSAAAPYQARAEGGAADLSRISIENFGRISDVYMGVITLTVTLILFNVVNSTAGDEYRIGEAALGGFNGMPSIPGLKRRP